MNADSTDIPRFLRQRAQFVWLLSIHHKNFPLDGVSCAPQARFDREGRTYLFRRERGKVRTRRAPCKGGAFQWVQAPPGDSLQPEAIGAVMEVTKWLKPSNSGHDLVTVRVCRPQRE